MNGFLVLVRDLCFSNFKKRKGGKLTGHNLPMIGQDNTSTECIVGDVPNIFDGNLSDHDGPYNGVTMGC